MAGRLARRVTAVRLADQALILAALAMMLLIPLLITTIAVVPLGSRTGAPMEYGQRLGLTPTALRQVQQLFPAPGTIRGATTPIGVLLTVLTAYSWPKALQRGYELIWGLPRLGRRGLWRPLLWVVVFSLGALALLAAGSLGGGVAWELARWVLGAPLLVGFLWWGQHLLLGGRVGWRPLLPGAVLTAAGLFAFRGFTELFFSDAIDSNYRQYGPIGIVFTLLSWLIVLSVVMLGGAVIGAVVSERRTVHSLGEPPPGQEADESPADLRA
jgi:membrane protein